jgi:hypothetical protein
VGMSKLAQTVQRLVDELHKRDTTPTRDVNAAAAIIREVRAEVFRLDPACICGTCLRSVSDQMHEIIPRSKTRNQPPEVRFSTKNCVRLSPGCHAKVTGEAGHGKRLTILCEDAERGANGPVRLTWKDGRTRTYQRAVAGSAGATAADSGAGPLLDRPGGPRPTRALGTTADARGRARSRGRV